MIPPPVEGSGEEPETLTDDDPIFVSEPGEPGPKGPPGVNLVYLYADKFFSGKTHRRFL